MKSIGIKPYLHVRTANSPVYHPEGTSITFITDYTGLPQVWEVEAGKGWPAQVSFTEERIMFVKYISGNSKRIIGMDEGVNERTQLYILEDDGELIPLTYAPDHIHHYGGSSPDGKWIAWSSNRRNTAFFDLYIQNLESNEIREVFTGEGTYGVAAWHPNGDALLVQKSNSNLDHDLGLLDLKTGEIQWLTLHKGEAGFHAPHFSNNGDLIYVLTNLTHEFYSLAAIHGESKKIEWIDEREWDLEELCMSPDKSLLAYTVNEGGISKGVIRNLSTGNLVELDTPTGVLSQFTFSPDQRKLAFVLNSPVSPAEIWEYDLESKITSRITYVSHSPAVQQRLVEPERTTYTSFDGRKIPAFYYRPTRQSNESLPVVVFVHGGPESQIRAVYNPFLQYFINCGFAVCTPNVRGSTGYGKSYSHLDDKQRRMDAVNDLTYLVEWLKSQGNADPAKIAIMGRSYGGFMVLAAVTHYPNLWAAGIDIVGISSFRSFLKNTSVWRRKLREAEYGSIEEDGAFFDQIDPLHHTDKITASMMVLHGANDPRVPIEEAEQIVAYLRKRNHPVEYIRFEDEGHFFVKLTNNITAYTRVAEFLDKTFNQ